MIKNIKSAAVILFAMLLTFTACKKESYTFGTLKTPAGLSLTTAVAGMDTNNPNGNGSGTVLISAAATNAITYKIDFGDGNVQVIPSGIISYNYSNPGTTNYTITVNAIGTGGVISTISKTINIFVAFKIPDAIVKSLTNNTSKTWVTDKASPGHVGVGAADQYTPNYYAASPNSRDACLYDDEITFTKDANGNITMMVDNKGQTYIIKAATTFYTVAGNDACYDISPGGLKPLLFMNATSASTAANSTRIQFIVPGNGIINFATGATVYEILSINDSNVQLRNIGSDGNAWYQILKTK